MHFLYTYMHTYVRTYMWLFLAATLRLPRSFVLWQLFNWIHFYIKFVNICICMGMWTSLVSLGIFLRRCVAARFATWGVSAEASFSQATSEALHHSIALHLHDAISIIFVRIYVHMYLCINVYVYLCNECNDICHRLNIQFTLLGNS